MIIAIDGPAGAGKSTTARLVAQEFGFAYIDTGAMYRAVALAAREAGLQIPDETAALGELARTMPIVLKENGQRIFIGPREVSAEIRTPDVAEAASQVAALPIVREAMLEQQRRLARIGVKECGGAVLEGRDIQTVVFPDAEIKIFLTAHLETRAARRLSEWQAKEETVSLTQAQQNLTSRDERDTSREVAPLAAAPDAILLSTDDLTPPQVVARITQIVRERFPALTS